MLKVNPSEKKQTKTNSIQGQMYTKTEDLIELKLLFQFSAPPALILGTTENATFAHFMKKSMHLKTGFLLDYQVLFLLLNGPQIETSLYEGSDTLILPFTSKTGQSVEQNRQKIF